MNGKNAMRLIEPAEAMLLVGFVGVVWVLVLSVVILVIIFGGL